MSGVIDSWYFSSGITTLIHHTHITTSHQRQLRFLRGPFQIIKYWSRNYRHHGPRGPGRGCCRMYAYLVQIDSNALEITFLLTLFPSSPTRPFSRKRAYRTAHGFSSIQKPHCRRDRCFASTCRTIRCPDGRAVSSCTIPTSGTTI